MTCIVVVLKSKEGLKQATEMALPVLMRVFFKTRLSTAISHFVAKSRFQQLPNLKIRSLLKSKEGLKQATEIEKHSSSCSEKGKTMRSRISH
ncbi:MAG: hypothetical protein HDR56_02470 [Treponema sp.]|nr:hypothetical protein [Treponema sp.]